MNNFIHEYCQNINIFVEVKNKYKSWKRKSLHWMKRDESFYLCPIIERITAFAKKFLFLILVSFLTTMLFNKQILTTIISLKILNCIYLLHKLFIY